MRIKVVYASESGNAAELADIVSDRLRRRGFDVPPQALGVLTPSELATTDVLFAIVSTTGQGALPANAQPTWSQLLRRSIPTSLLTGCDLAIFGLGDSSYPRFNWAVRKVHARLNQLGARDLVGRGEGDDQSPEGYETVFDQWLELVLPIFDQRAHVSQVAPISELLEPRYSLHVLEESAAQTIEQYKADSQSLLGTFVENSRITAPDHFQDVRHVVIDVPGAAYEPGDVASVHPANADDIVNALIENQDWPGNSLVEIDGQWLRSKNMECVQPPTLRNVLKWHLDLNAIPRRQFFSLASHFATDSMEKERLAEFGYGSGETLQDLYDYANRPRRSIAETILEFSSLKVPATYILDLLPALRSRQFSIASKGNSSKIELCIAIVRYRTILRRIRRGICTAWLDAKRPGDVVYVKIHPNRTHVLDLLKVRPAIIVAAGTGIAPVRSLLLTTTTQNRILLFFGCRTSDKDWLYHEELSKLELNLRIFPAFSRQNGGYVQQKILSASEDVAELFQSALIFVCGSSGQMPNAVRAAFADVLCNNGYTREDAEGAVRLKEKQGLYIQETW